VTIIVVVARLIEPVGIVFGIVSALQIPAQSQPAPPLAFEVASVKPNKSGDNRRPGLDYLPGGRFSAVNVPLYIIIAIAYNVPFQSSRLSGGPDWTRSERYDIEAKAEEGSIPSGSSAKVRDERMRWMLQTLLADRFKLTIRREMREQPVYALVISKRGPKLQRAKIEEKDCPEGSPNNASSCHALAGGQGRGIHGQAIDMSDLVLFLANWTDRPMIDKTGIQGLFNIQTEGWAPLRPKPGPPDEGEEAKAMSDPSRPTLFAVLEQLGLKLESQRAPVEMFVIEHVEKPSEN
jgi:uncharacterized protein (TIGR03435 family)